MNEINNYNNTNEEIQFYRKMLVETCNISKDWLKTLKIIIFSLSMVLVVGIIACSIVCNIYLRLAYDTEGYEKNNTTTNINRNINENENK